jgi:SIR2-like domain
LAAKLHTSFSREVSGYDKGLSSLLLKDALYPELFEQMRLANQPRYFKFLSEHFGPKKSNEVYLRFIRALRRLPTACIVTTNVDEALEQSMHELTTTVQRSDIERIPQLLHQRTPFICKLHGSASSVETMVFSTRDYEAIKQNNNYLNAVRSMFSDATVLFLGYGLRDEYVIRSLQDSSADRPLFGTGPHFIVTPEERIDLPKTVRRIRYVAEVADHRAALQTLEAMVDIIPSQPVQSVNEDIGSTAVSKSIYFIADLIPPGTWTTSQSVLIKAPSEPAARHMIVGEGYVDGEVELHDYSALHDIIVGLICFDIVCVSIDNLARVHDLLGSEAFWIFVKSDSLRLVIPPSDPAIIFPDEQSPVGFLTAVALSSREQLGEPIRSTSERIREQMKPAPGKEQEAEELFQLLESSALIASEPVMTDPLPAKTHGALINPSIRRLLGVSEGTPVGAIPRWVAFPILRLAKVINNGRICQRIHANSTRMIWGTEKLASVAFSAATGTEWADEAASYVLSGRYDSDVGAIISREPGLLLAILRFRESSAGESFRREIAQSLAVDNGGEIITAINAALHHAIPTQVLQRARDQLSGLYISRNSTPGILPMVWGDLRNSDARIAGWRKRSRAMLEEVIKRQKLGAYDSCPCGSGESLKFCCQNALRVV